MSFEREGWKAMGAEKEQRRRLHKSFFGLAAPIEAVVMNVCCMGIKTERQQQQERACSMGIRKGKQHGSQLL